MPNSDMHILTLSKRDCNLQSHTPVDTNAHAHSRSQVKEQQQQQADTTPTSQKEKKAKFQISEQVAP